MKSQSLIDLEEQFGAHNYKPLDVVLTRGTGVWVYDVDGKRYLDCLSAYSALSQGHIHPEILKALKTQAEKLTLTSRAFRNDQLGPLYKDLADITGYEMFLLMNTGVEAVETAIKLARKWAYQVKKVPRYLAEIIVASGNFHGRTIAAISCSSEPLYREDFGPYAPGFIQVKYGEIESLKKAITENTAAIILEPIQGENGVVIPPDGYIRQAKKLCETNNILFIADEIQTGLGRTGRLFACQHEDVRPDITVIGKALSGGFYPISAVLSDKGILGLFNPGEHGSTFGGNPLAAAIARAAIHVIINEKMIENSAITGSYFLENLQEINSPTIKEVRGKGLLIGMELKHDTGGARRYCEALMNEGILAKETHEHVIRFAPPLIIDKATVDWAATKIRKVMTGL